MVRVIQLIYCDECVKGNGTEDSPLRRVIQLWPMRGKSRPVVEIDPHLHMDMAEIDHKRLHVIAHSEDGQ